MRPPPIPPGIRYTAVVRALFVDGVLVYNGYGLGIHHLGRDAVLSTLGGNPFLRLAAFSSQYLYRIKYDCRHACH